jgi:ABC-2 type transport system ATP-binding protein
MIVGPPTASPDPAALTERAEHVRTLVIEGEIDLAARRLLDFARDFSPERSLTNQAMVLLARVRRLEDDIRQFGEDAESKSDRSRLNDSLLKLLDLIEGAARKAPNISNEAAVRPTPDTGQHHRPESSPPTAGTAFARARIQFLSNRESQEAILPVCRSVELEKSYDPNNTTSFRLSGVTLELNVGRITGVVAANGHGKTTLLRLLARELAPTSGTLEYPALDRPPGKGGRHINSQIAYVPQTNDTWGHITLETRLCFTAALFGRTTNENHDHVEFMLHRLGLDQHRAKRWAELSTGFRVRGAIANALLSFPKLLILDEPLANLDITTQMHFLEDLRDLTDARENAFAVVVTSQHLHEIEAIADELLFLEDGLLKFYGPKESLGHDREFNTFEIGCDHKRDELLTICSQSGRCEISRAGTAFVFRMPLAVDATTMLRILVEAGVHVHYFRDISRSTRTMLRIER